MIRLMSCIKGFVRFTPYELKSTGTGDTPKLNEGKTMNRLCLFLLTFSAFLNGSLYAEDLDIPPPPSGEQGFMQTLIMISIAMAFFYFIILRPEQKRKKALEDQRESLQKGMRVIAMGIVGTVVRVQKDTVIVKMYDGAKVEFLKAAISEVGDEAVEETSSNSNGKRVELAAK